MLGIEFTALPTLGKHGAFELQPQPRRVQGYFFVTEASITRL